MPKLDASIQMSPESAHLLSISSAIDAERARCASIVEALILPVPGAEDVNTILHAAARAIREGVQVHQP